MFNIRLKEDASETASQMQRNLSNLQPAIASIGQLILQQSQSTFEKERSPENTPWTPLTAAYLKRKRGGKILTKTGKLRSSINIRVGSNQVVIATTLPYAAVHEYGSAKKKIPARPFLSVTQKDVEKCNEILTNHVLGN